MANPKRKHSKSRKNKRRSTWKLTAPILSLCPQCHQPVRPHFICPNCGYYNGQKIIKTREEIKEAKKKKGK